MLSILLCMLKNKPIIRNMKKRDWKQVNAIYNEGLATGLAAFMSKAPNWMEWNTQHLKLGRLVSAKQDNTILGWAALQPVPDT